MGAEYERVTLPDGRRDACGQRHRTRLKYGRSGRIVLADQAA